MRRYYWSKQRGMDYKVICASCGATCYTKADEECMEQAGSCTRCATLADDTQKQ